MHIEREVTLALLTECLKSNFINTAYVLVQL